ncbi:MAG: ArsR/SmtB family transcription factor [Candidatus Izemoplasmataceae bacterium]
MDKRDILATISNKNRYKIIHALLEYEQLNVSEIIALTKLKQANTSRHLKILTDKKIIKGFQKKHFVFYRIRKEFLSTHYQLIKYLMI